MREIWMDGWMEPGNDFSPEAVSERWSGVPGIL